MTEASYLLALGREAVEAEHLARRVREDLRGSSHERRLGAVAVTGSLRFVWAVPDLERLLGACEEALSSREGHSRLPGSEGRELEVGAAVLESLAKLDTCESHWLLLRLLERRSDRYLRAEALRVMGLERSWHDESVVRRYLSHPWPSLRVAALNCIYLCSGPRLDNYRSLAIESLFDPSPCVTVSAVGVLTLFLRTDRSIPEILRAFSSDRRRCKATGCTVAEAVSPYVD